METKVIKVIRERIAIPENYTDKETGTEKTFWHDIGTITTFLKEDGTSSKQVLLPAFNMLKAQVFPIKE